MSKTIAQIVTDALNQIGVVADGRAASPFQAQQGAFVLNDNLLTMQRDGWRLGWYPITTPASIAPLRDEDIADVTYALCAWLSSRNGVTIPPAADPNDQSSLANQIKNAFTRLSKRSIEYVECDLGELSRPQGGPYGGPNWL